MSLRPPDYLGAGSGPAQWRAWEVRLQHDAAKPDGNVATFLPRDIDIRVVLSKSEFEARFGRFDASWGQNGYCLRLEAMDDERRWHIEIAKMNKQGASNTHLPVDFQCQPLREGIAYLNEQRMRLDDIPGLVPPWED